MTRRYRTDWRAIQKEAKQAQVASKSVHDLATVDPKFVQDEVVDWELALDALMHTGGGTWQLFEQVANQVESSALFTDTFARALESLGHLEIQRDDVDLRPIAWEVGPSTLVSTRGGHFLSGYWPGGKTLALVDEIGTDPRTLDNRAGPASWFVTTVPSESWLSEWEVTASIGWEGIAQELDPLSALVESLPVREVHVRGQLREFDLASATWTDTSNIARPGAYRMSEYTTQDVLRTRDDVENGTMRIGLVHLNKHAAALVGEAAPLIYYDENSERLAVPLGMDLPGLYGRAVVLASGRLPLVDTAKRLLVYVDVPKELAEHIYSLLSS